MIFKQFYLACLSHASYLIGDPISKNAAVVDPQRDIEVYLDFAEEHGLTIKHVFLTHFHADFVAGHLELQERVGATIYLGRQAHAEYAFQPMSDGDVVELGEIRLSVLETPGHTPESISIVIFDRSESPAAVLTGDTLFVGDVGRPDLLASIGVSAQELSSALYDSIHGKLLKLPDSVLVYPAHGSGSMCGKNLSKETVSTIGEQRRVNYALKEMSREAFMALVSAGQPEAPAYFGHDAVANRKTRRILNEVMTEALSPLSLEQAVRLSNSGALLLDVRDAESYARAHIPQSIHIGLDGKFATWCGSILHQDQALIIIGKPGQEQESVTRLARIGFDKVVGYVQDIDQQFARHPHLLASVRRITAAELSFLRKSPDEPVVVDIRSLDERQSTGSIPGSTHIPLLKLAENLCRLPRDRDIVLQCASGYRSSIAVSLLLNAGFSRVMDLAGGYSAWSAQQKQPVRA